MAIEDHRWSGWPGAYCLDCGRDDPIETAVAEGKWDTDPEGGIVLNPPLICEPCPEPGSRRHDPYARLDKEAPT